MSTVRHSQLENGIRVLTDSIPTLRSVSIGVLFDVGTADAEPGHGGLAHLCEHLLFQGTSNRDALAIARFIDETGGHVGGFTSRDYTCFYGVVQAEYQTFVIDLLGDIVLNSIFPSDAITNEQRAIVCELQAADDDPEQRAHALAKALAWRGDGLGRPITGSLEEVTALTREDLIYFTHRHYLPERAIIVAAGQVDHDDFVAHVRDAFWRLIPADGPADRPPPATFRPGFRFEPQSVSQAYFSIALEAPAYAHPDRLTTHVVSELLGGGLSSRLFYRLREAAGLVYAISSTYHAYRRGGMLLIEGSTEPRHLTTVIEQILDELDALAHRRRPPSADELQRARARLRGQIILASEDSHARMSRLATQELYFQQTFTETVLLEQIDAVDDAAIAAYTRDRLRPALASMAVGIVGPEAPEHYDAEKLASIFHQPHVLPQTPLDGDLHSKRPAALADS